MRARAFAAVAAATAIAALSICGSAGAAKPVHRTDKSNMRVVKPSITETFVFRGSNGYTIVGTLRDRHELDLTVSSAGGSGLTRTSYSLEAPQKRGSHDIKVSLGKLGRIDVRFVAQSVKHEKAFLPACEGPRPRIEAGRFVGRIDFRGEDGYTDAHLEGADGLVTVQPELRCNLAKLKAELDEILGGGEKGESSEEEPEKGAKEVEFHVVVLQSKPQHPAVVFKASRISMRQPNGKSYSLANFSVKAERHRGRIDETAEAIQLLEPGSAFQVPDLTHLTQEGVVKPPAPFTGSATYRRESPHSLSWTGDLAVNLPGFGLVHLAGPKATATVCADDGCGY